MPEAPKPNLATLVWDTEIVVGHLRVLADMYALAGLDQTADRAILQARGWQKVVDVIAGAMVLA